MMKFEINGKKYILRTFWEQVTIQDAVKLSKVDPADKVKVLAALSDCPEKVLDNVDEYGLKALYGTVEHLPAMLRSFDIEQYKPGGFEVVWFKGVKYYLPTQLEVGQDVILMHGQPAKNCTEAANLVARLQDMKESGLELLSYICALYLKPDPNAPYDEKEVVERAKVFQELPMSVAWEVFFCIYFSFFKSLLSTLAFLAKETRSEKVRRKASTLTHGFMLSLKRATWALWSRLKRLIYGR
jgi:hypothetical protein